MENDYLNSSDAPQLGQNNSLTDLGGYAQLLVNPADSATVSIPDGDPTPHTVKSVNWNTNTVINSPNGLFVWAPHSMNPGIRQYVWDQDSLTSNYLITIKPDQDLSKSYLKGRSIAGGISMVSNQIASGAFSVAGSFSAVSVNALPPLNELNPNALTQYAMDGVSVLGSVPTSEGIVLVSPITDTRSFRYWGNSSAPGPVKQFTIGSEDLLVSQVIAEENDVPITRDDSDRTVVLDALPMYPGFLPNPRPFGNVTVSASVAIHIVGTNFAGTYPYFFLRIFTARADPVTFKRIAEIKEYAFPGVGGPSANTECFATITITDYFEAEIVDIELSVASSSIPVGTTRLIRNTGTVLNVRWEDYYDMNYKEPALIVAYTGVSAGQQLSISGRSHWELTPNYTLSRDVNTYYCLEDTLKHEAARLWLVNNYGSNFAFVYGRFDYLKRIQTPAFRPATKDVVYHAATISPKFKMILNRVLNAIARPGINALGSGLGLAMGNPLLGSAFSNAGLSLYDGWRGKQTAYHASTSSSSRYRCSTLQDNISSGSLDSLLFDEPLPPPPPVPLPTIVKAVTYKRLDDFPEGLFYKKRPKDYEHYAKSCLMSIHGEVVSDDFGCDYFIHGEGWDPSWAFKDKDADHEEMIYFTYFDPSPEIRQTTPPFWVNNGKRKYSPKHICLVRYWKMTQPDGTVWNKRGYTLDHGGGTVMMVVIWRQENPHKALYDDIVKNHPPSTTVNGKRAKYGAMVRGSFQTMEEGARVPQPIVQESYATDWDRPLTTRMLKVKDPNAPLKIAFMNAPTPGNWAKYEQDCLTRYKTVLFHSIMPLVVEDGASIGAWVVFSRNPFLKGEVQLQYTPVMNLSGCQIFAPIDMAQTNWQLFEEVMSKASCPAFIYLNGSRLYLTVVPFDHALDSINGDSWQYPAALALLMAPASILTTGGFEGETNELTAKMYVTVSLGLRLYVVEPFRDDILAMKGVLEVRAPTLGVQTYARKWVTEGDAKTNAIILIKRSSETMSVLISESVLNILTAAGSLEKTLELKENDPVKSAQAREVQTLALRDMENAYQVKGNHLYVFDGKDIPTDPPAPGGWIEALNADVFADRMSRYPHFKGWEGWNEERVRSDLLKRRFKTLANLYEAWYQWDLSNKIKIGNIDRNQQASGVKTVHNAGVRNKPGSEVSALSKVFATYSKRKGQS